MDKVNEILLKCLTFVKSQREAKSFTSYAFAFSTALTFM